MAGSTAPGLFGCSCTGAGASSKMTRSIVGLRRSRASNISLRRTVSYEVIQLKPSWSRPRSRPCGRREQGGHGGKLGLRKFVKSAALDGGESRHRRSPFDGSRKRRLPSGSPGVTRSIRETSGTGASRETRHAVAHGESSEAQAQDDQFLISAFTPPFPVKSIAVERFKQNDCLLRIVAQQTIKGGMLDYYSGTLLSRGISIYGATFYGHALLRGSRATRSRSPGGSSPSRTSSTL